MMAFCNYLHNKVVVFFIYLIATCVLISIGCWKRSAGAITATAILMLTACLLASGAMGLWHTVEFFEKEKVVGEEYFQQWPNVSYSTETNNNNNSYLIN
jgi:hypothetical protein